MAKGANFICGECGARFSKWSGRCESCGAWNAIVEEPSEPRPPVGGGGGKAKGAAGRRAPIPLLDLASDEPAPPRRSTGLAELDRVLGGGLTDGSAILLAGEPGVGKSTLLLHAAARLAETGAGVIYVSGEEAPAQIRQRALRLGLAKAPLRLAAATQLEDVLAALEAERPTLAVIDSVQTLWSERVESAPGSVGQVRAAAHALAAFAKQRGVSVVLVGHVTKDGAIAGPKVMEHVVDTVLSFEGEPSQLYRILRASKNRFGAVDEIGVFEMTGAGLAEVANPSALFLGDRAAETPGSVVFAGVSGARPVLVEIQALVSPEPAAGSPRRAVVGLDGQRAAMILAALEARAGVFIGARDVYLNVAGGLKIAEPAADLAIAAALLSAAANVAAPRDAVIFGEISLSGAVRPAPLTEARLKEAAKLGFSAAWGPPERAFKGLSSPRKAGEGLDSEGERVQFDARSSIESGGVRSSQALRMWGVERLADLASVFGSATGGPQSG